VSLGFFTTAGRASPAARELLDVLAGEQP
jgi:hypothetical protein